MFLQGPQNSAWPLSNVMGPDSCTRPGAGVHLSGEPVGEIKTRSGERDGQGVDMILNRTPRFDPTRGPNRSNGDPTAVLCRTQRPSVRREWGGKHGTAPRLVQRAGATHEFTQMQTPSDDDSTGDKGVFGDGLPELVHFRDSFPLYAHPDFIHPLSYLFLAAKTVRQLT